MCRRRNFFGSEGGKETGERVESGKGGFSAVSNLANPSLLYDFLEYISCISCRLFVSALSGFKSINQEEDKRNPRAKVLVWGSHFFYPNFFSSKYSLSGLFYPGFLEGVRHFRFCNRRWRKYSVFRAFRAGEIDGRLCPCRSLSGEFSVRGTGGLGREDKNADCGGLCIAFGWHASHSSFDLEPLPSWAVFIHPFARASCLCVGKEDDFL